MVRLQKLSRLRSIAALAALAALAACGGGSDDNTTTDLRSFSLSSGTVTPPASGTTAITATWSASATGLAANNYHVSAHAIAAGAAKTPTDANKFLGRNCNPAATCGDPQTQACTFSSTRVLSCGLGTSLALNPGTYTIVAQACGYDDKLNSVCSSKETTLTVQ